MMKMIRFVSILGFWLTVSASAGASENVEPPRFRLSGYGSLGVSHSSQALGDYVLDGTVPNGAGRSHQYDFGNNSRVGIQGTVTLTRKLSGVVQVVSQYQSDNTYRPAVEWANLRYDVSPNAYVRAGRVVLPTFMYSDTRKVGYSYPWIHPPVDLYRQTAITSSDGIEGQYRVDFAEFSNSVKLLYGSAKLNRPTSISHVRNLWGIFDTLEYGAITLRAGYQRRDTASESLLTGVWGPWTLNTDLTLAAMYDPGDWFVIAEWMERETTNRSQAGYLSAGVRLDGLTPYVLLSADGKGHFTAGGVPTAAAIRSANRSQSTLGAGVCWDVMKNTAFKLEYDRVMLGSNSNGSLANVPANVNLAGSSFHVVSGVVDFVF